MKYSAVFVPVVGEFRVKDCVLWSQSAVVFTTKPELTPTHYIQRKRKTSIKLIFSLQYQSLGPWTWDSNSSVSNSGNLGQSVLNSTVQYSTVQYSTVQYSTVQYSTVQYSTVQYSAVQYVKILFTCELFRETEASDFPFTLPAVGHFNLFFATCYGKIKKMKIKTSVMTLN